MLSCPVEALKLTACPDNTALLEDNTVAVMTVEEEPSLLTLTLLADRETAAAKGVVPVGVVVDTARPPQLARSAVDKTSNKEVSEILNLNLERTEFPRHVSRQFRPIAKMHKVHSITPSFNYAT